MGKQFFVPLGRPIRSYTATRMLTRCERASRANRTGLLNRKSSRAIAKMYMQFCLFLSVPRVKIVPGDGSGTGQCVRRWLARLTGCPGQDRTGGNNELQVYLKWENQTPAHLSINSASRAYMLSRRYRSSMNMGQRGWVTEPQIDSGHQRGLESSWTREDDVLKVSKQKTWD